MLTFARCQNWIKNPRIVFPFLAVLVSSLVIFTLYLFPLSLINFIFWSVLMGLACLYRPNWCFFLLLALLPFETLNLLPVEFGLGLRPYQWLLLLLSAALAVRLLTKRTTWPLFTLHPIDYLFALLAGGALISGIAGGGEGLRLGSIVTSFFALYLLARVFFRTPKDIELALMTFVSASVPILFFAILQNSVNAPVGKLTTVMLGRPNATFSEPDWLGFFAACLLLLVLGKTLHSVRRMQRGETTFFPTIFLQSLFLIPICIVLIISVSRSAWLAAAFGGIVWLVSALVYNGRAVIRETVQTLELSIIALVLALIIVTEVPLTRFDLMNRAESTATGLQEITVACDGAAALPERIENVAELSTIGCRHIFLEERIPLAEAGYTIGTTKRPDPNVTIRASIYERTWEEVKAQPFLGIGWGNIGAVLGRDENGASYNASNLFLEVWLGAGLLGLLSLLGFVGFLLYAATKMVQEKMKGNRLTNYEASAVALSLVAAFLIFNLFNAGLLLGFVWVFLATLPIIFPFHTNKSSQNV